MELKIKRNINKAVVEISLNERDDKVALGKAITFAVEDYCDACKSRDSIVWKQNKATDDKGGTFLYIKRRCIKCGAESTMGEYQGGLGYFWKPFEVFKRDGQNVRQDDIAEVPDEDIKIEDMQF